MTALSLPYTWRTAERGIVEVDRGRGFEVISLEAPNASTTRVLELVPRVLAPAALEHGIPLAWLCAIAYAESGGNPSARSPDGGFGLMQIQRSNFAWLKLTEESALEPYENVRAACELLTKMGAASKELPEVASRYNAGADPSTGRPWPSTRSPWGMRETPGHIERVVRANNWFVLGSEAPKRSEAGGGWGGVGTLAALLAFAVGLAWWRR